MKADEAKLMKAKSKLEKAQREYNKIWLEGMACLAQEAKDLLIKARKKVPEEKLILGKAIRMASELEVDCLEKKTSIK